MPLWVKLIPPRSIKCHIGFNVVLLVISKVLLSFGHVCEVKGFILRGIIFVPSSSSWVIMFTSHKAISFPLAQTVVRYAGP